MEERITATTTLDEAISEMENMYLCFTVGNENYGVEIRYVLQIIGMQEITRLPEMPCEMQGFINLRGSIIPVISMRVRFGKSENEHTERTCIVVVKVGDNQIGLIVDSIQEAVTIDPEHIAPPPATDRNSTTPYLKGIARLANNNITILIHVQELFAQHEYNC